MQLPSIAAAVSVGSGREIGLWVGGHKLVPDAPPVIELCRVLVSDRVVAKALGDQVEWVPERQLMRISRQRYQFDARW